MSEEGLEEKGWSPAARAAAAAARAARAAAKKPAGIPSAPDLQPSTKAPAVPKVKAPKVKKPRKLKIPKPKKSKHEESSASEQGKFNEPLYPAQAGSPLNRYFPASSLFPASSTKSLAADGWDDFKLNAAIEARKALAIRRGVSPRDAHQEAGEHLTRALERHLIAPETYVHNHLHNHGEGSPFHGIVHGHVHMHVKGNAHPDPRLHHHEHPANLQEKLKEKFSWMVPFEVIKEAGRRLIKGAAITIGRTRNKSKYTEDELLRSARTLGEKKPIYINHLETPEEAADYLKGKRWDPPSTFDPKTIPTLVRTAIESMVRRGDTKVGTTQDSEFEDDTVEYVGAVTDPDAIKVVDAGLVKGPSIGAVPRNRDLKDPRGIIFEDLSLITAPETPGDPDATCELMEKLREMVTFHGPEPSLATVNKTELALVVREMLSRVDEEMMVRIESDERAKWSEYLHTVTPLEGFDKKT
jgi:hypothetical protein